MPNPILILTALLINIICVWSVLLMRREEYGTSRKYYFLLLSGIPAGAVFALGRAGHDLHLRLVFKPQGKPRRQYRADLPA